MKKGKFIVIDGTDGSGKATQIKLLFKKLKQEKIKVKMIDFPQYYDNFFGKLIGESLRGDYGDFVNLDPKITSVLYAADRFESSQKIKKWLDAGYIVLADRYTSANQIHQGGKISNKKKRDEFLSWLDQMEFEVFKIAKPDLIIFLSVPIKISQKLVQNKNNQKSKKYLKNKKDQSENDENYLKNSFASAQKLVQDNKNWIKVECTENGKMLSREEISEMVWNKIKKIVIIKRK